MARSGTGSPASGQRAAGWLEQLHGVITNRLDPEQLEGRALCGILGDVPSTYAKSPKLWNAAFRALHAKAVYVAFDIPKGRLAEAVALLRAKPEFLGGSVTVPYKKEIIPLLDAVDPLAEKIGAVNVIARSETGKLTGFNTDGLGGLKALVDPIWPGASLPEPALAEARVLLIGAGGAAQAVAVFLWERMPRGELLLANRTADGAAALAARLASLRNGRVSAIAESAIPQHAANLDLVVNASVKGQAGIRKLADGRWTCLEPYSALAPAHPASVQPPSGAGEAAFWEAWHRESSPDIVRNHELSLAAIGRLPRSALCYDIIYAPVETEFLRQARLSGHLTLNGKPMNVLQAVEAFMTYVCPDWLRRSGFEPAEAYPAVAQAMAEEWAK